MIKKLISAATIATVAIGGFGAVPASAQDYYSRNAYHQYDSRDEGDGFATTATRTRATRITDSSTKIIAATRSSAAARSIAPNIRTNIAAMPMVAMRRIIATATASRNIASAGAVRVRPARSSAASLVPCSAVRSAVAAPITNRAPPAPFSARAAAPWPDVRSSATVAADRRLAKCREPTWLKDCSLLRLYQRH